MGAEKIKLPRCKHNEREGKDALFCSMSGAGRGKFFIVFVICEILNFANVLGQIYFTDK
jgi:hypothetical protein